MLQRELPNRDKRMKSEFEADIKRADTLKTHEEQKDIEIQKAVSEENKEVQAENRKKMYKDNIKKGRDYELFIIDYFKKQGYTTKEHGILNGKKDKGIDVIIKKDKEITLIQCKNWKQGSSYKIKHTHLKEFVGNTTAFLDNNRDKAEGYIIKRMYVTSNDVLDNSARHFLRDNNIVEHRIIPMVV